MSSAPASTSVPKPPVWRIILLVVVAVLAGLGIAISLQPSEFKVTRSATIAAPPDAIFPYLNNLHNWQVWSPWAKLDPDAKATFTGPDEGVGAQFGWDGNEQIGAGTMTITGSVPHEQVEYRLEFTRPFEDTSMSRFELEPVDDGTHVTWSMFGKHTLASKAMCLFMNMDEMLGSNFEEGLKNLAQAVKSAPGPKAVPAPVETPPQ